MSRREMAKRKLIRLASGAIESEEGVGLIILAIKSMASNSPTHFQLLARWHLGLTTSLSEETENKARTHRLLKADKKELYDDVKDVLTSLLVRKGQRISLGSSCLHADQNDINVEDYARDT